MNLFDGDGSYLLVGRKALGDFLNTILQQRSQAFFLSKPKSSPVRTLV